MPSDFRMLYFQSSLNLLIFLHFIEIPSSVFRIVFYAISCAYYYFITLIIKDTEP